MHISLTRLLAQSAQVDKSVHHTDRTVSSGGNALKPPYHTDTLPPYSDEFFYLHNAYFTIKSDD